MAASDGRLAMAGIAGLLVGLLLGAGGYALLDRDPKPAAAPTASGSSAPSGPSALYHEVEDLCQYVDASAFGKPRQTDKADPNHCFLSFGSNGDAPRGAIDMSGGMLNVDSRVAADAEAAGDTYTTLKKGVKKPATVDGIGDEAFSYTAMEKLQVDGGDLVGAGLSAYTLALVVRHDNLVLELTYQTFGERTPPSKDHRKLEKLAATTLRNLAKA
ncbi:MAG: hypothetical protein ACRDTM_09115 [Micromonosporaceae bacterium]